MQSLQPISDAPMPHVSFSQAALNFLLDPQPKRRGWRCRPSDQTGQIMNKNDSLGHGTTLRLPWSKTTKLQHAFYAESGPPHIPKMCFWRGHQQVGVVSFQKTPRGLCNVLVGELHVTLSPPSVLFSTLLAGQSALLLCGAGRLLLRVMLLHENRTVTKEFLIAHARW